MPFGTSEITVFNSSGVETGTLAMPLRIDPTGTTPQPITDTTTGTLANGTQTAVSSSAVSVLAANANRRAAIIQNTGTKTVRIGVSGVTATTGIQLAAGATAIFEPPFVVTGQFFAIRESQDSTVFATEIT